MKRIFILLSLIAGITFIISCEKEQENPVLDLTTIQAPTLTAPAQGGNYTLLQDNADDTLFIISWNAADYQMDNLLDARYAIEIDKEGNDFASPATIATIDSLSNYPLTVTRLNDALGVLGFAPDEEVSVSMRVRSFIPDAATRLDRASNVVTFNATPYKFKVKPIYILGGGTEAGWDNSKALEMEHVEDATYARVVRLLGGTGELKFISVLGQWAPQWGRTSAAPVETDGVITGVLSYRPTESVPDPPAIRVPAEAGQYRVVADTIGLTFRIEPVSTKMFVIGTDNNMSSALEMKQTAPGKFFTTVTLDGTANRTIQFTSGREITATRWGSASGENSSRARLVQNNSAVVNLPAQQGTFRIEVNLGTQTYTVRKL